MDSTRYYGTYKRYQVPDDNTVAGNIAGPDNAVGDIYTIVFVSNDGHYTAWLRSRFGVDVAYLDEETTYQLQVMEAQGKELRAVLAFLCVSRTDSGTRHWGEMAIFAYQKKDAEVMETFIAKVAECLGEGYRPTLELPQSGVDKIFEAKGDWIPLDRVPYPEEKNGEFVFLKKHRSIKERAYDQGRKGNIGCYIISWAFIIALVAGVAYLIYHLIAG